MTDFNRQDQAYKAAARVNRHRMAEDAPLDAAALAEVQASDIVVVGGIYDHVERVLAAMDMPHTAIAPEQLGDIELSPHQLLVVNCPGQVGQREAHRIRDFVDAGGSLFTTDWALKHVIEPAFPNTISYNQHPTTDDVVRIEVLDHDNPFLRGVMDANDDPQWWLEASSYPISVHDPERVKVLIQSSELAAKYGESPVAVTFEHGAGEVFHMVSHYYLQRTELRDRRHAQSGMSWAAEKGVAFSDDEEVLMDGLSLGEVEAAGASTRPFSNVIAQKKRKQNAKEAD